MRGILSLSTGRMEQRKAAGTSVPRLLNFALKEGLLECFGHVTGADAAGTGLDSHDAAVFYRSDLLQVRIPHGAGFVVGMAHIVSEAGPFSTDITFS